MMKEASKTALKRLFDECWWCKRMRYYDPPEDGFFVYCDGYVFEVSERLYGEVE